MKLETMEANLPKEGVRDDGTYDRFAYRLAELLQIYGKITVIKNGHHLEIHTEENQ